MRLATLWLLHFYDTMHACSCTRLGRQRGSKLECRAGRHHIYGNLTGYTTETPTSLEQHCGWHVCLLNRCPYQFRCAWMPCEVMGSCLERGRPLLQRLSLKRWPCEVMRSCLEKRRPLLQRRSLKRWLCGASHSSGPGRSATQAATVRKGLFLSARWPSAVPIWLLGTPTARRSLSLSLQLARAWQHSEPDPSNELWPVHGYVEDALLHFQGVVLVL